MDITIKNIPNEINQEELLEWVSILIERKETAKISPPKEIVDLAKANIDNFRKANLLNSKFENGTAI